MFAIGRICSNGAFLDLVWSGADLLNQDTGEKNIADIIVTRQIRYQGLHLCGGLLPNFLALFRGFDIAH